MDNHSKRKYILVIKRGNKDYLPLEWHLTTLYKGEDLHSLEGIDSFTMKMNTIDLINDVLNQNMVNVEERFQSFAIIYFENGRYREVKEGVVFAEESSLLNIDGLINFIYENIENKVFINEIYNLCTSKEPNQKLEEFKYVLKNIELFKVRGRNAIIGALSIIKDIPYEIRRSIVMKITTRVIPKYYMEEKNSLIKKDNYETDTNVA